MTQGIKELIVSGQKSNLLLAQQFCISEGLDFDVLVEEIWDLDFWMTYLPNLPNFSNIEAVNFLFTKEEISLSFRKLLRISDSIGLFSNLKRLFLNNNELVDIPKSICNLQNLQVLFLNNNKFNAIPESVAYLKGLKILGLSEANVQNISDCITNLHNLEQLRLYYYKLPYIPQNIDKLRVLKYLYFNGNLIHVEQLEDLKKLLPKTKIYY